MKSQLPTLASAGWLRAHRTQAVLRCLAEDGFGARIVGGAVRNALLGLPVLDIDIATTATPDQVIAAAEAAGFKTIATGLKHGTVTVVVQGQPFEVTTLRRDVETDGRHATVAFTDDWGLDASRRDLTLNALYCDADGTVYDPLGGFNDLRSGIVRFIGDPRRRIAEDYLRILRFFRFTAEYASGAPDAAGLAASVSARAGLERLSAERVRGELLRLLVAPRAVPIVETMATHGLLTAILPVAPRLRVFARLASLERALGVIPNPMLRLASLAIAVAEDAPRLAARLRLSGVERGALEFAASHTSLSPLCRETTQRAWLYRLGPVSFRTCVLFNWACRSAASGDVNWLQLFDLPNRWSAPKLPFTGGDLVAAGQAPGPHIGRQLAAFEAWWIAADFPLDPIRLKAQMSKIGREF